MIGSYIFLFIIFAVGLLGRSFVLVIASLVLGGLKLSGLNGVLSLIENRGIKLGLLFLLLSVLAPIVNGEISLADMVRSYKSVLGVLALISGILATKVNGMGLNLLDSSPELIVGIVLGSIIGIIFLDGIPVGPLTAGGLMALFYQVYLLLS